jgi:hypothetical protein
MQTMSIPAVHDTCTATSRRETQLLLLPGLSHNSCGNILGSVCAVVRLPWLEVAHQLSHGMAQSPHDLGGRKKQWVLVTIMALSPSTTVTASKGGGVVASIQCNSNTLLATNDVSIGNGGVGVVVGSGVAGGSEP